VVKGIVLHNSQLGYDQLGMTVVEPNAGSIREYGEDNGKVSPSPVGIV
jgi:hypothetical protein